MTSVLLIDTGSGNVHSARKALLAAGAETVELTADADAVRRADRLLLPGVGAFASCAGRLRARDGLEDAIREAAAGGTPLLGICVGMQLLADEGFEHGRTPGLGLIPGAVRALEAGSLRVPHMGWNEVTAEQSHPLLPDASVGAGHAYFVHSYCFAPTDPDSVAATCTYGEAFPALIARGTVAGTQFHPEKSQAYGLDLLSRFLRWSP